MTKLQTELLEAVVFGLNEVAPDTLNEGDNGNWYFIKLESCNSIFTLLFENDWGEDTIVLPIDIDLSDEKLANDEYYDNCIKRIEELFFNKLQR